MKMELTAVNSIPRSGCNRIIQRSSSHFPSLTRALMLHLYAPVGRTFSIALFIVLSKILEIPPAVLIARQSRVILSQVQRAALNFEQNHSA